MDRSLPVADCLEGGVEVGGGHGDDLLAVGLLQGLVLLARGLPQFALMSTIRFTSGMFLSTSRSRIRDLEQCAAKEPDQSVSLTGIRQTSLKIVLTFLTGLRPTFR